METKPFNLQAPESIAKEYAGNKKAIAQAAQMGLLDPTAAVLAGMFIDRMRTAAMQEQAPTQTVAQETFAPPAQPQMGMPQGQMGAPQTAAGLPAIDIPENMYGDQSYAGGGIVAFQAGGSTDMFGSMFGTNAAGTTEPMARRELVDLMTLQELQEYNRTKKIPDRLRAVIGDRPIGGIPQIGGGIYTQPRPPEIIAEQAKAAPGPQVDAAAQTPPVVPPAAPAAPAPTLPAREETTLAGLLSERQALMPEGEAYAGLEKEIQESRAKREEDKKQSMWMRVAEMGFGMMASDSPYLAQAVGQAGTQAIKGYADDLKEQKKLDREDRKFLADIDQARRAEKRGDVDKASELYSKSLDRLSADDRARLQAETSVRVAQISAGAPGAEEKLIERYARAKGISFDQAVQEIAAAKAEGRDPMLSYLRGQLGSGREQVDIRSMLNKFDVKPTR
jgi:hypothetical protein